MSQAKNSNARSQLIHQIADELTEAALFFEGYIAKEVPQQVEGLDFAASGRERERLTVWVSMHRVSVTLRSSMPSDEELGASANEYCYWIDLAAELDKDQFLARLKRPAFQMLADMQVWVWIVNKALMDGHPPNSAKVRRLISIIDERACRFAVLISGVLETWAADYRSGG